MLTTFYKYELYKTKGKWEYLAFLSFPLLLFAFETIFPSHLESKIEVWQFYYNTNRNAALNYYILSQMSIFTTIWLFFIPSIAFNIESKNTGYNLLFTLPTTRRVIYNAKLLGVITYMNLYALVFIGSWSIFMLVNGFSAKLPWLVLLALIPGWNMVAIFQFMLRTVFKNFIVYLLASILFLIAFLLSEPEYSYYMPYYYSGVTAGKWINIIVLVIYSTASYIIGMIIFDKTAYER